MTRIVRRFAGTTMLVAVLAVAGTAEAADRGAGRRVGAPAWGPVWGVVWQRLLSWIGAGLEPVEEIQPRKGAGIDPNGAVLLDDPAEPIPTKKGAGIDPNG